MPSLNVRGITLGDVAAAAGLLAARQARDRARIPFLGAALATPARAEEVIRPWLDDRHHSGVVAERSGEVVGYLFGEEMLLKPEDMAYQFILPHSIGIGVMEHALAEGEDATVVYRAMYAALSADWVRRGFFDHDWAIVAGDAGVQEAVVSLGFGRHITAATRPASDPVPGAASTSIEVHLAGAEDIDVVFALEETLNHHHSLAPMFWPILHTTDAATRAMNLGVLQAGETPYFVAYEGGKPVGMQTFLKPGFTPPIVEQDGDIYLFNGIVEPDVRSGGVGTAILKHALGWLGDRGYRTCSLHFAAQNFSGGPFWLSNGFVPVEHTMRRHIDERVAWAR
jgi:GNAT superfamily N-acetyltransferase